MSWLQDLRVAAGGKYSPIVDPLGPVLTRGGAEATGARKADLLAHIAWATFHKSFDGLSIPDLTPQYKAALVEDPDNPFAHAFLGHWIAWSDGSLPAATSEFEAALAANRARPFVRRLQAASLRRKGDTGNVMLIALINDMRRGGEGVDELLRSDAENVLAFSCGMREYPDRLRSLLAVTPAAEMVATSRAFFSPDEAIPNESRLQHRRACLATFLESAGQRDEALAEWRKLRDSIPAGQGFALRDRAEASVKRLGARQ